MAQKVNFTIDQGATFSRSFTISNTYYETIDLSGHTANSQMRKSPTSSSYFEFTAVVQEPNIVTLSMTANTTGSITAGRYLYDIETTSPTGTKLRVQEGIVTVTPQITQ